MPKLLSEQDFNLIKNNVSLEEGLEIVESCNKNNCVTNDTKLIIVGTITPPEGAGYFYTAPRNKIYGYIDQALKTTSLKDKKKELLKMPKSEEIIESIKTELKKNNIAFLDIIKYAIRKKDSPYDADIKYYTLDVESFKNIKNAKFICNSIFARDSFIEICKQLNINPNFVYLSQRMDTKKLWLETINKLLFE